MKEKKIPLDLIEKWIQSLIEGLDESWDEETKKELLEKCGRACSFYHGHIEKIEAMKRKDQKTEEILDRMNKEGMWCGDWIKEGNTLYSICQKCECPLVLSGIVKLSPTFCYCSRGFVKSIFETILDRPVQVELKKAIGRGDDVCQFIVNY